MALVRIVPVALPPLSHMRLAVRAIEALWLQPRDSKSLMACCGTETGTSRFLGDDVACDVGATEGLLAPAEGRSPVAESGFWGLLRPWLLACPIETPFCPASCGTYGFPEDCCIGGTPVLSNENNPLPVFVCSLETNEESRGPLLPLPDCSIDTASFNALQVFDPTIPSTTKFLAFCKAFTADSVFGPKWPSIRPT